jgi:N-acetylneuraminate synthase
MSDLDEVALALYSLAYGALCEADPRGIADIRSFASKATSREWLESHVVILHCTTEYPAPFEDVNLRAMSTMSEAFGLPVGLSDHTVGITAAIAAAALGAVVIEKHLTLSRSMPGPDHLASLEPTGFALMVKSIKESQAALGSSSKLPANSEAQNRRIVRRSLAAAHDMVKGHKILPSDLVCLRPGGGLSPDSFWSIVGKCLETDIKKGEFFPPDFSVIS